ncbi:hypothetical protein UFOVP389_24 [uncultured Caudovirales phage]|uniref:Uncharacterized protein n=1 Tax=uncultured Caudovirales phage TaxID=2100421 RepID=A0A6J7X3S8_9CAUD|nr:hypothetical protein UFOVP389_24 [uncultured Caudovirales phage]
MAIKTGEAALTARFTFLPVTGFIPYNQGILDPISGTIKAQGQGRWGSLLGTKWSTFNSYVNTFLPIRWTSSKIDTGEIAYFNIAISSEFTGSLFYRIYVSNTGDFTGEETEYVIQDGDSNIAAFYGRFIYVTAECSGVELGKMQITTDKEVVEFTYRDLNTSTLGGSSSQRTLNLDSPISLITEMVITPRAPSAYAVDLYVSNTATSTLLIPIVINKAAGGLYIANDYITTDYFASSFGASFALYGIDNQPRDGIVDISLKGLPRQVMTGGNLLVIK